MKKKKSTRTNIWKFYENTVHRLLELIPNAIVKRHPVINKRKFDFLVKLNIPLQLTEFFAIDLPLIFGGDCKLYGKKVDIKIIDSFRGMLENARLPLGIIVSEKGFTKGAIGRSKDAGIIPVRIPWDLSSIIPTDDLNDICESCSAANDDSSPGMIQWDLNEYTSAGYGYMTGQCSKCGVFFIQCFDCGSITGFPEGDFDEGIICSGNCGRISIVDYDRTEYYKITVESYDSLEIEVLTSCCNSKNGLTQKQISKIIDGTKWRFWTVGDPLIRLREEGKIENISSRTKITSLGNELIQDYIINARVSFYGW